MKTKLKVERDPTYLSIGTLHHWDWPTVIRCCAWRPILAGSYATRGAV